MAIKERKQITGTTEQINAYEGHEGQIVWDKEKKTLVGMSGTVGKNYPLASQTYVDTKFLPLTGGELLGAVSLVPKTKEKSSLYLVSDGETDEIQITVGGETIEKTTRGTSLTLRKTSYNGISSSESSFSINAKSSKSYVDLTGSSAGSLTWAGKEVERVNAIGANYIRFESGLQVCWGRVGTERLAPNISARWSFAFPLPFSVEPSVVSDCAIWNRAFLSGGVEFVTTTDVFGYYTYRESYSAESGTVSVIAVGKWK